MIEKTTFVPVVGKHYKNFKTNDVIEILYNGTYSCFAKIVKSNYEDYLNRELYCSFAELSKYYVEYKEPISKFCTVTLICRKNEKHLKIVNVPSEMTTDQIKTYYDRFGYEVLATKYITLIEGEFSE